MTQMSYKNGFAIIDKEAGWTSHDVVARTRKILDTRKVGHSGTLDPPATGLLILGVGKATRLLRYITELQKEYAATMVLGSETDTLDAEGEVTKTTNNLPTLDQLRNNARTFVGEIEQIPPMVSAVKVQGKRLYELAREGKDIPRKPRQIVVNEICISETSEQNIFRINVKCGSGTYIRSLVADIASKSGSLAHVGSLRRTAIGSFTESTAKRVEELQLISMTNGLRDYEKIEVTEKIAKQVMVGSVMEERQFGTNSTNGPWVVVDPAGNLLAVYEKHKHGTVKPAVVITQESQ